MLVADMMHDPPALGDVAALMRSRDWSKTSLGPYESWSPSLNTVLRLMFASRYAMWMGWGPELSFFYNDAYAAQTLGAKHPAALGQPASEVWAEIWPVIGPRVEHVLSTGEGTWDEGLLLFLERSGYAEETYHTFSYSAAPGDEPGVVGGLFCVVVEETERVLGERRIALLHDLAARLSQNNTAQGVIAAVEACLAADARDIPFALTFLFDEEGQTARLASLTGFDAGHPSAPEQVAIDSAPWPFREVLASGAPVIVELDPAERWPSGAWDKAPSRALVLPIAYQGHARPAGAFVAGVNPHRPLDRKLQSFVELFVGQVGSGLSNAGAYEDEKRRADALAEVDRAKTIFFSNVSHEFRTPLTLMLGPTEDALGSPERALRGADLETVHRNELRLLKLVNTLLDFARIEAGRTQGSYELTDLAVVTTDLANSFRSAIERAGLTLEVAVEPVGDVYVDREMWEKIVLNLLSNALKFTFDGRIFVGLGLRGEEVELTIRDTGVGIAPRELPRLFERFHRIEGTRARTHEGSGIGLALVQDLVKLHRGTIDVRSQVGEGTEFIVKISRGVAHLSPDRIATAQTLTPTALRTAYVAEALRWVKPSDTTRAPADTTAGASRPRVLVADDNADVRDYMARLLGERWDVELVENGEAALQAIRRRRPELVLSDVMMPGIDGFGLLHAIRSDPALRATPVILLSARAGEEAAAEGLSAGADDYIVKPFAARDLVVRVASRLATAKAAHEANLIKENLYRHFMQAPFPIAVFRGPDHVVELANAATLRTWGKTEQETFGRPLLVALPELRDQPFLAYLDGVFRSGVAYQGRGELARLASGPNGELTDAYFTFVYAPLLDQAGATEGVLMSAFDVTAQVRTQQEAERARDQAERLAAELARTTNRLRAAQRVGGIGIFDWDRHSVDVSPELYALLGLTDQSFELTPDAWTSRLLDEQDREAYAAALLVATRERRPTMEVELRLRQADDSSRWVRVSCDIQYDLRGEPARVLGAVVDIQLLKEAAAARSRALEAAERTSRAKDEFLATMSHELRTPLNAMLGWSRLLRQSGDGLNLAHGLEVIERNAQTQARLISDLLDVSRIIGGKLRLTLEKVPVAALVGAAVDVVRQAADGKGVELLAILDPDVGSIVGDPDRLQQIVWNLLSNAVKFTPRGGSVTILAERDGSNLVLRIADTGVGISTEHLTVIFERFRQVDSSMTRSHGGLGLGLAIVRHLIEAHGGTVDAESRGLGLGATFTVRLPLRAVFAASSPTSDALEAASQGRPSPDPAQRALAGARILTVDDDADSLDLLRVVLEGAGAEVTSAPSARVALQESDRRPFDLVVSDIGMPEMDGYAFMSAFRARRAETPALALTAYARAEDAHRARQAGYQRHVAKPVDGAELVASIAALLARQP